ncbi:unnamed protein product [Psylliodes chrysocephalus]|uniref:Uncharacterized protein n=1 Tax=Psylliodes chrysocephalus TaxID=3402493 RepID=A0A9P0GF05_9CUCU|nr:unnamed protein product [Psylliodes chrysocephala]
MISIEEDKQFLINQRKKGRPGFMYGIDLKEFKITTKRKTRIMERREADVMRKEQSDREVEQMMQTAELVSTSSSILESDVSVVPVAGTSTANIVIEHTSPEDMEFASLLSESPRAKRKRGFRNIMTTKLCAALDKRKISDRDAVHILIATIEALDLDVQEFIINRSSIHFYREKIRKEKASKIKKYFKDTKLQAAVVHWDGKLLPALTETEQNALCDICIFIVSVYIEAWFCAPSAAKAPYQDFTVLSKLFAYQAIDRDISQVALQKLSNHLWYLSPEVVALAFFDPNVPFESKIKMVNALNRETELLIKNEKRIQIQIDEIPPIINDRIEQFVTSETREFFKRFELDDEFLMTDPLTWHQNECFVKGLELVNKLKVVNDSAERGV